MSADGGASFEFVEALELAGYTDRGPMAAGPGGEFADGSLWIIYRDQVAGDIVVRGAALDVDGDPIADFCGAGTGFFCNVQIIARDDATDGFVAPGHITVGPLGQVLASYFRYLDPAEGSTEVFTVLDADGLGSDQSFPPAAPPSTSPVLTTNVGLADQIPSHAGRTISPLANLAWDRTMGRVYLVSTREEPQEKNDTDIVILTSDDAGAHWSAPKRVNDDPPPSLDEMGNPVESEVRSQFLPHVAVDQATGEVAVAWYDARNDAAGSDGMPNTEAQAFLAISTDFGDHFENAPAADGLSRSRDLETSYGDYLGVAFDRGAAYVAWTDNSSPVNPNPDCGLGSPCMDVYAPEPGSGMQELAAIAALLALSARRARRRTTPVRAPRA